jgi:hypothetical protein
MEGNCDTADKGWSPTLGVGQSANKILSQKKKLRTPQNQSDYNMDRHVE